MADELTKDAILLQQREIANRAKEKYVQREADISRLKSPLIKVIIGPRRAGKSFFAINALAELGETFGYANFDDEKLAETKDYNIIVESINSVYHSPKILLFDEIQNLKNWELFANRLQRQGYNLVITGSNSNLLSKELATHLTGRHLIINILPFSFKEFIASEQKEMTSAEIREKLNAYIAYGGYPEPLLKQLNYREYLSILFDSIIYKDIVRRFRIRNAAAIEDLSTYLISNIASEFSCNKLALLTKCKSSMTVEKYLKYLEESFLFFIIKRFSYKLKEQVSSNKKIYCIDNGFIHAKAFKFSSDTGRLFENIVAIELKRQELNGLINVYYWKSKQQEEVDFVVKTGTEIKELIQVCCNMDSKETKKREIRALIKAGKELNCKQLTMITSDYESEEEMEWFGMQGRIKFIPLWKYLTQTKSKVQ